MEKDKEYVFIESDFSPLYRQRIKEKWDWKTFPIIVKSTESGDKLIGGYAELRNLLGFLSPSSA
jgi:hypothetical protein